MLGGPETIYTKLPTADNKEEKKVDNNPPFIDPSSILLDNVIVSLSLFLAPIDLIVLSRLSRYFRDFDSDLAWEARLNQHFLKRDINQLNDEKLTPKEKFVRLYEKYYQKTDPKKKKLITLVKDNNIEKVLEEKIEFEPAINTDTTQDIYFWAAKNKSQVLLDYFYSTMDKYLLEEKELIFFAVKCNQINLIREFINQGLIVHSEYIEDSPLFCAAYYGHEEIVKLLVNSNSPINPTDERILNNSTYVNTPLHVAAKHGHNQIVKYLTHAGANINLLSTIYVKHFGWNNKGFSALHVAAQYDQAEVMITLLHKGADKNILDCKDQTPLHLAIIDKSYDCIQILINTDADLTLQKNRDFSLRFSPFHLAVNMGIISIVELMLTKKPEIIRSYNIVNYYGGNDNFESALHIATRNNHIALVTVLIKAKADINALDQTGNTALHLAAMHGHIEIGRLLIAAGANVNAARPRDAATPLHLAVIYAKLGFNHIANFYLSINDGNKVAIVSQLENPNLVNAPPNNKNQLDFIHLLIDSNAYIDPVMNPLGPGFECYRKITPLHIAILNNAITALRILIQYNANPTLTYYYNQGTGIETPSESARSMNVKIDLYIAERRKKNNHSSFFKHRNYEEKVAAATKLLQTWENSINITNLPVRYPALKKGKLKKIFDRCVEIDKKYEVKENPEDSPRIRQNIKR